MVAYHDKTCARSCPADISTYNVDIPRAVLAAADLWDRENGYVRIKLNEFRQWDLTDVMRIAHEIADKYKLNELAEEDNSRISGLGPASVRRDVQGDGGEAA